MTAAEIVARVREYGGDIALLPDGYRLTLIHRRNIPDDLAALAKSRAPDLRALLAERCASFPPAPPVLDAAKIATVIAAALGVLSTHGKLCNNCGKLARCYEQLTGRRICTFCITGDQAYGGD